MSRKRNAVPQEVKEGISGVLKGASKRIGKGKFNDAFEIHQRAESLIDNSNKVKR